MSNKTVINNSCNYTFQLLMIQAVVDEEKTLLISEFESQRKLQKTPNTQVLTIAPNEEPNLKLLPQAEPAYAAGSASENGQVKAQF
jgi:hypothetical protein